MKFYTSYFYQIRFFTPNMIPISTAKWDPKWYQGPYIDKNGVINGLRAPVLVLPDNYDNIEIHCGKPCIEQAPYCNFMNAYRKYLNSLDFQEIYERCCSLGRRAAEYVHPTDELQIILMVHESKSCPCAERPVIQEWFKQNGVEIMEWSKLDK